MKSLFLLRLCLDFLTAGLLLAALAYDWLGNVAHEIIGTGMFLLLISHNIFNRRWYGMMTGGWGEARTIFSRTITLSLLVVMVALLITSVIISRTVFSYIPLPNPFIVRQIHALLAYLVLFIAALHLGLQWSTVIRVLHNALGIREEIKIWTYVLRAGAAMIATYGLYSLTVIDVRSKLFMEMSFRFWDFETATVAFFLHIGAIVGLCAALSYYLLKFLDFWKRRSRLRREKIAQSRQ